MSSNLKIVMYHYTRNLIHSRYPNIKGLDSRLFEEQLDFFAHNFNVVKMEDVLEAIDGGNKLPENALLLTFDDGYIDNFTIAFPLLMKYGMQGSFFIPGKTFTENVLLDVNKIHFTLACASVKDIIKDMKPFIESRSHNDESILSFDEMYESYAIATSLDDKDTIFCKRVLQTVLPESIRNEISSFLFKKYVGISESSFSRELYMNRYQIKLLREAGMFIGLHGYDHYWLGNLQDSKMQEDVDKALDVMDEFIDSDKWVMNYPYGSYNDGVIDAIKNRGCVLGLTTEVRSVDITTDSRYKFPRLDCNDFPPKSEEYIHL